MHTETITLRLTPSHLLRWLYQILRHHAPNSSRTVASEPIALTDRAPLVESTPPAPSAVQGGKEKWWIQFIWAVYYAAGTLVFSSIMAVTVIELVVWVILSCYTVAASRLLAFRLCTNWK